MSYRDKKLICTDCMSGFIYTGEEQEATALNSPRKDPSRCPACRASWEAVQVARANRPVVVSKRRY